MNANPWAAPKSREIRRMLVSLDERVDPVRARANTRELIERVGVLAMIGSTFSNTVLGALPVLAERGVPLIAPIRLL